MRFINTTTLQFEEVSDSELGSLENGYAILSHRWTWGDDEILYADALIMDSAVKAKLGYPKFEGACRLARTLGYKLLWNDTCCINKTDSVELGEAINSMYRWYARSNLCIAYLEDVVSPDQLKDSIWFDRGWTLQELIAPKTVYFYSHSWELLGDKNDLAHDIVARTGIPSSVLSHKKPIRAFSIAQRMSWAAKRTTKRLEDRAYSLMGLFDVNMPMIYGERERAFVRLQEQIILKSADESVFVWDLDILEDSTRDAKSVYCSLFATSPACFARCGDVVSTGRSSGFGVDQFGISIHSPMTMQTVGRYQAPLEVTNGKPGKQCVLSLVLLPGEENVYVRTCTATGDSFSMMEALAPGLAPRLRKVSVPMDTTMIEAISQLYHGFWLRKLDIRGSEVTGYNVVRRRDAEKDDRLLLPDGELGTAGIVQLSFKFPGQHWTGRGFIKLGFDATCSPVCSLSFPDFRRATHRITPEDALVVQSRWDATQMRQIFDDGWTRASSLQIASLPSHCYDSRLSAEDPTLGFYFTHQTPVFDIAVSAERVPDGVRGEVWAVDITICNPEASQRQNPHR